MEEKAYYLAESAFLYDSKSIILQIKFDKQQQTMLFYEPFSRSEETPKEIKMETICKWGVDHDLTPKSTKNAPVNLTAKFKGSSKFTHMCIVYILGTIIFCCFCV